PGRGAQHERPYRRLQQGAHRADRQPGRNLRASGQRLRRRLRRRLEPRLRRGGCGHSGRAAGLLHPAGEDPDDGPGRPGAGGGLRRRWHYRKRALSRSLDPLPRRARRRRRADGDRPEPRGDGLERARSPGPARASRLAAGPYPGDAPVSLAAAEIHAGPGGRLSTFLYLRPRLALLLLLLPPLLWLGIVYLGALLALLAQSFFSVDDFSGLVVYQPTLATYAELFTPTNLSIILR